jgi:hypothetical protein
MIKRKIKINTRAKREIDRYPMVAIYWLDICSLKNEDAGSIDEIGNTTIIPNSVIVDIKKIVDKGR